ncbi:MAG TPA: hypothetical protein VN872_13080 [Candidatus Acidoferrum sp.]|nr:hypothetical protein [Candidatus Acidoferrum sp.]
MWTDASQITPQQVQDVKTSLSAVLKTIISVVGGAGSVIALVRTSLDLLQNRSLVAKRNSELERAGKFADLLGKFSTERVPKDHQEAISTAVQCCLQECITNVATLSKRLDALRLDPNSALSAPQKLLLTFRPASWQGWALHVLTYASSAWCAWYVFHSGIEAEKSSFSVNAFLAQWRNPNMYLGLAFLLVVGGIFRAWAMEERRRSLGYRKPVGHLALWLVIRFPENTRMLLAQIMFFVSSMALLTVIHLTVRDMIAGSPSGSLTAVLIFASMLLTMALVFRNWALAELTCHEQKPQLVPWKTALFAGFFKNWRTDGLLRTMYFLSLAPLGLTVIFAVGGSLLLLGGSVVLALVCLFVVPLPSMAFSYALFRSLKIKHSLAAGKETQPVEKTVALSVTA